MSHKFSDILLKISWLFADYVILFVHLKELRFYLWKTRLLWKLGNASKFREIKEFLNRYSHFQRNIFTGVSTRFVPFTEINSREERNRQFFADDETLQSNAATDSWPSFSQSDDNFWQTGEQRQQSVLLQIEESEELMKQAAEREQEVGHIVRSISDLNHIFKVSLLKFNLYIRFTDFLLK